MPQRPNLVQVLEHPVREKDTRGYEKKADAFPPAFFRTLCCLFIEGADPLKRPWVGLAPSEMPLVLGWQGDCMY